MVCATTGLLRRLEPHELEGVLAHELSHVAHRDVAVMTIASFLGILAGLMTRFGALHAASAAAAATTTAALPIGLIVMLVSVWSTRSASCSPVRCRATASWPPTGPGRCSPGGRRRWPAR